MISNVTRARHVPAQYLDATERRKKIRIRARLMLPTALGHGTCLSLPAFPPPPGPPHHLYWQAPHPGVRGSKGLRMGLSKFMPPETALEWQVWPLGDALVGDLTWPLGPCIGSSHTGRALVPSPSACPAKRGSSSFPTSASFRGTPLPPGFLGAGSGGSGATPPGAWASPA